MTRRVRAAALLRRLIPAATLGALLAFSATTQAGEPVGDARADEDNPQNEPQLAASTDGASRSSVTPVDRVRLTQDSRGANGIVCRREKPIGSHVPVRVCRTEQQRELDRVSGKRDVRATQRRQSRIPTR